MVKSPGYIPDKGDCVWLIFDPQSGREQSGKRPAVVISPRAYNAKVNLALFCPVTSQIKGYPFEVLLPDFIQLKGVILADHIKSLDWKAREAEFICSLPSECMKEIIAKLTTLISV